MGKLKDILRKIEHDYIIDETKSNDMIIEEAAESLIELFKECVPDQSLFTIEMLNKLDGADSEEISSIIGFNKCREATLKNISEL